MKNQTLSTWFLSMRSIRVYSLDYPGAMVGEGDAKIIEKKRIIQSIYFTEPRTK